MNEYECMSNVMCQQDIGKNPLAYCEAVYGDSIKRSSYSIKRFRIIDWTFNKDI